MLPQQIAFGVLSAAMVLAALRLVTTTNMVRAALFLTMVLAGAAGQFILLAAEFVAVVQLLVYVGAIVVLFLFGIMLTRAPIGRASDLDNDQRWVAAMVALFLTGVLAVVLLDAFPLDDAHKLTDARVGVATNEAIADSIFSTYVIPFEVISVLLLAALVGAIVIARRD
jgi:NADH-quinone oxidoreductase subunit J